ncbi:hypothetical protein U0070_011874 [Myodes glareolus]|uniref:Large ribosomal subunit protein uL10 n=1 Tax=Myodes glareolus TaxID=447135 RepID=A0AAW0K1R0_MYOGA
MGRTPDYRPRDGSIKNDLGPPHQELIKKIPYSRIIRRNFLKFSFFQITLTSHPGVPEVKVVEQKRTPSPSHLEKEGQRAYSLKEGGSQLNAHYGEANNPLLTPRILIQTHGALWEARPVSAVGIRRKVRDSSKRCQGALPCGKSKALPTPSMSRKRNIPHPSGLVFQQLLADGAEVAPRCTVGSNFSDYWLRQRKLLPQHIPLLFKEDRVTWKSNYFLKIIQLLDDYPKCFFVGADNVGSKQMQQIRMSL